MSPLPQFPLAAVAADLCPSTLVESLPRGVKASDYQWLSLKSWSPDALVSQLDGSLVVDFADYHDPHRRLLGFVGGEDPTATVSELLEHLRSTSRPAELHLVDETTTARLPDHLHRVEDPDHSDYVYDPEDVAALPGHRHHVTRNEVRRFERRHGSRATVEILAPDAAPWADLVDITEKWAANTADPHTSFAEVRAMARCALAAPTAPEGCEILVSVLRLDGHPVGFDVTEVTPEGWAIDHFRHTPRELIGSHGFLRRHLATTLRDRGVTEWNAEQDLGVLGLRTRKLKDRPSHFITKYRITTC